MIPGAANPLLLASAKAGAAYNIERSVRFNAPDSAFLSRTPSVAGNRKTWTLSFWCKRTAFPAGITYVLGAFPTASIEFLIGFNSSQQFYIEDYPGSTAINVTSAAFFRDPSAWCHFLVSVDTTQATAANRVKLYANGPEITAFATTTYPTQNHDVNIWDTSQATAIGARGRTFQSPSNFYLADVHFIDAQALDPTSFGEFDANGVWQPKAYTGSYGTNGFHLPFSDNSTAAALGTDTSGNSNNWTVNNISVAAGAGNDSLVDTPTNYGTDTGAGGEVRGNCCTLNPLDRGDVALVNGNLESSRGTFSGSQQVRGTIGISSGKWYWEVSLSTEAGFNDSCIIGLANSLATMSTNSSNNFWGYVYTGVKYSNASTSAYGAAFTNGDIIGVAFDADSGSLTFYKNNVSQGAAFTGLASTVYFPCSAMNGAKLLHNFGQRPWAFTPPAGFKALCTTNLPAPVVAKPSEVMDVALYTGNGSTQTISGLGFSPDLVWVKCRNGIRNHVLSDTIRGTNNVLASNTTAAQASPAVNGQISAFNSDGFAVAAGTSDALETNNLNDSYVAWCWDAGSSTVTNTQGSITSQVRANPSAGFSIVTYTGNNNSASTVGHGLNVAPPLVIAKSRTATDSWIVYTSIIDGSNDYLVLNSTAAKVDSSHSSPTSTVFNPSLTMGPSVQCVAYCFAPVAGYSSFGSYVANASSDGPFVYTGFKPRFVLCKLSSAAGADWLIFDTARSPYNVVQANLRPNTSGAEESAFARIDILSNGFKVRAGSGVEPNSTNGNTYIYAAWAELPYQYSRAA